MKQAIFVIFATLASSSTWAQVNGITLTEGYLRGKTFSLPLYQGSCNIKFGLNAEYTAGCSMEGVQFSMSGKWHLENGTVRLAQESSMDDYKRGPLPDGYRLTECHLAPAESNEDLDYDTYLACTGESGPGNDFASTQIRGFKMGIPESLPIGKSRVHKGINIILIHAPGKTKTAVMFREWPSPSGPVIEFNKICTGDMMFMTCKAPEGSTTSVPAGFPVTVIGRTPQKTQVGQWNNYWYLVQLDAVHEGWMFGEFVQIENSK